MQQGDFEAMYKALEGKPMTVRYLDPPLHEFVPHVDMKEEIDELAKNLGITSEEVIHKINALHESNPMMGHRGCRLAVTYPEIAEMQTRAVLQAAIDVTRECGYNIVPEIMIPLVGSKKELAFVKSIVDETAKKVFEEQGMTLNELVTLASFVQEEAGNSQDSNVAQVFRNRLAEGSPYPKLQSLSLIHI